MGPFLLLLPLFPNPANRTDRLPEDDFRRGILGQPSLL